jgi:hypothetical protein
MKIRDLFRMIPAIPGFILLILGLVFTLVGIFEISKTDDIVNSYYSTKGTVIGNDYLRLADPQNSARARWTYHAVVRFFARNGSEVTFTDREGAYPEEYETGTQVDVIYDPVDPQNALISSWSHLWLGPLIFLGIGLLPEIVLIVWAVWRYYAAERRVAAEREKFSR